MLETLKIDRKKRASVSSQIVEYVRSQIQSNQIKPGQRLPTTAEIIKQIRVGNHTVRDALAQLEQEGYIEATPGRGTFVVEKILAAQNGNGQKRQGVTRVALSSAFADATRPDIRKSDSYRVNSVQGFLDECGRMDISGIILPEHKISSASAGDLHEYLLESNCEGLVWLYPDSMNWAKVRYLHDRGFPVVVTHRSHPDDQQVASVEGDEFRAGIMTAKQMIEKGCQRLVVLSYYEDKKRDRIDQTNFPIGFNDGLRTVYERHNTLNQHEIEFLYTPRTEGDNHSFIKENLMRLNGDSGVIFSSGYDFFQFILSASSEDIELLRKSELIVSCTRHWTLKFAPLVRDLNFNVLVQPFEEVVRCAVQKLVNIVDGKLENTSTLVNVELADFWQFWRNEVSSNGSIRANGAMSIEG